MGAQPAAGKSKGNQNGRRYAVFVRGMVYWHGVCDDIRSALTFTDAGGGVGEWGGRVLGALDP